MTTSSIITEDARLVELAELFDESMHMYVVNDECATRASGEERKQHRDSAAYWVDLAVDQAIKICSIDPRSAWGASVRANAFDLIQDHEPDGVKSAWDGVSVLDPKP